MQDITKESEKVFKKNFLFSFRLSLKKLKRNKLVAIIFTIIKGL